jgi:hypothetical protein
MRIQKNAKKTQKECRPRLSRLKLPPEEFFRTALVAAAIAGGSMFKIGDTMAGHQLKVNPSQETRCQAFQSYVIHHPFSSSVIMAADLAACAAFSIVYFGAISVRRREVNQD